jgi:hypothetical protein
MSLTLFAHDPAEACTLPDEHHELTLGPQEQLGQLFRTTTGIVLLVLYLLVHSQTLSWHVCCSLAYVCLHLLGDACATNLWHKQML